MPASLWLLLTAPSLGADPARPESSPSSGPAPSAPPAPGAPAPAPGPGSAAGSAGSASAGAAAVVIARAADQLPSDPWWLKAALRCAGPNGPSMIYLPQGPSRSTAAAYDALLRWTEARLERQVPELEAQAGRICYERKLTEQGVVDAVGRDPRSIGVVSGDVAVPPGFVVLWRTP